MENEASDVFYYIAGLIILLFFISMIANLFTASRNYDHKISDRANVKASSRYTMAYGDREYYLTPQNVLSDIVNEQPGVEISINGNKKIDADYLEKAKSHNEDICNEIRNVLGTSNYKKVTTYDAQGNVVSIDYEGGH